ncbi:IS21 family transposase [Glutamicibacter ardleyensis]|uniref:IS21 family transposase n=3 Tax=Glutamicibacter ardleyensis TaxID=225894 RepID=UPI003FD0EB1A
MADYRAIMQLLLHGHSYEQVTAAQQCSKRAVASARKAMNDHGINSIQALDALGSDALAALFPDGRSRRSLEYAQPDYKAILERLKRDRNYTLQRAWDTYLSSTITAEAKKYGYAKFCARFSDFVNTNDLSATIHHEPGKAMQVDWAGQTLRVTDILTGEQVKAYLFVAVLPYSGLVFVKASLSMNLDAWISLHVDALEHANGVPKILIPDNARTATYRPTRGDKQRLITAGYAAFATHYGCAIVPARVKAPKDKAATERAVQTVNKRVIGYLQDEVFSTLDELNEAIADLLEGINELKNPQGLSKRQIFDTEEAAHLGALPEHRYGQVSWKQVKVGRNYHVSVDYQHYSAPYRLAGKTLKARVTDLKVALFDGEQLICEHLRKSGRKGQYSTLTEHAPPAHQNIMNLWSRNWFLDRARAYGPATVQVITQVLDRRVIEAQGYLDCQNILDALGKKSKTRLEAACRQLLNTHEVPTYSALKRIMAALKSDTDIPAPSRPAASMLKALNERSSPTGETYVRDSAYYQEWN